MRVVGAKAAAQRQFRYHNCITWGFHTAGQGLCMTHCFHTRATLQTLGLHASSRQHIILTQGLSGKVCCIPCRTQAVQLVSELLTGPSGEAAHQKVARLRQLYSAQHSPSVDTLQQPQVWHFAAYFFSISIKVFLQPATDLTSFVWQSTCPATLARNYQL